MTQLSLFARKQSRALPEQIDALVSALSGGEWRKAFRITKETGLNDRQVRAAANASEGQVISGQQGYKLTKLATMDEIDHATAWMRKQANEMTKRVINIERVRHGH